MSGGSVFFRCSCGMSILVPADAKNFYCWNCGRQWPRNPRAGRPVQYGSSRPRRVYRAWPERGPYSPRPQAPVVAPATPMPKVQPANFRMSNEPVIPPSMPSAAAPAPAAAKAHLGFSFYFWLAFVVVMLGLAAGIIVNPRGFVDNIESLLAASRSSSSGSSSAGSGSTCDRIHEEFSAIGDCSRVGGGVTKAGYSYCNVEMRSNSGCQTNNGVTLCDTGFGQAWIPNECIP